MHAPLAVRDQAPAAGWSGATGSSVGGLWRLAGHRYAVSGAATGGGSGGGEVPVVADARKHVRLQLLVKHHLRAVTRASLLSMRMVWREGCVHYTV